MSAFTNYGGGMYTDATYAKVRPEHDLVLWHEEHIHELTNCVGLRPEPTIGEMSDGYHTFNELYEHRHALFMVVQMLLKLEDGTVPAWKSRTHADGTSLPGWFIAGIKLPTGDITYHLPDCHWNICPGVEVDAAPAWDGHTPNDVIERLHGLLRHAIAERK